MISLSERIVNIGLSPLLISGSTHHVQDHRCEEQEKERPELAEKSHSWVLVSILPAVRVTLLLLWATLRLLISLLASPVAINSKLVENSYTEEHSKDIIGVKLVFLLIPLLVLLLKVFVTSMIVIHLPLLRIQQTG